MPLFFLGCFSLDFSVWAPNALTVDVVSSNGQWKVSLSKNSSGVFFGSSSAPQVGDRYQMVIDDSLVRFDPRCQERDGNFSVVTNSSFGWRSSSNFSLSPRLVVYELHVPSFAGTLDGAIAKLPFLASLGVSVVELMPVSDFLEAKNGWGYSPSGLLSCVMKSYGGGVALKRFVDECHLLGMGVLLDVVFNHFDPDNFLLHYDSNATALGNGIYFYNKPGYSMTYWGPRPNFGDANVVAFLKDALRTFVEDYRIDGFRFDSTVCIRKPGQSCWTNPANNSDGILFLQQVNQMLSNKLTTAEDDQGDPDVTESVQNGGLGFDSQWGYQGLGLCLFFCGLSFWVRFVLFCFCLVI